MTSAAVRPSEPDSTSVHDALGALSEPLRWEIVALLSGGERCVCDLEDVLDLPQSRLSYHLSVLRKAGILSSRREGRWMYYSVSAEALAGLGAALERLAEACRSAERAGGAAHCE